MRSTTPSSASRPARPAAWIRNNASCYGTHTRHWRARDTSQMRPLRSIPTHSPCTSVPRQTTTCRTSGTTSMSTTAPVSSISSQSARHAHCHRNPTGVPQRQDILCVRLRRPFNGARYSMLGFVRRSPPSVSRPPQPRLQRRARRGRERNHKPRCSSNSPSFPADTH